MKRKKSRFLLPITFALLLCVLGFFLLSRSTTFRKPDYTSTLHLLADSYLSGSVADKWWLEEIPPGLTPSLAVQFQVEYSRMTNLFKRFSTVSPLASRVEAYFQTWDVGYANAFEVNADGFGQINGAMRTLGRGLELFVFVPKSIGASSKFATQPSFYSNKANKGKVIVFYAFRMPDNLLAAIAMHEVGHAVHYWIDNIPSSNAEEVPMWELTFAVLDQASGKAYGRALRDIGTRAKSRDYKKVLARTRVEDLKRLDEIIGCAHLGEQLKRSLFLQHLLLIGFQVIGQDRGNIEKKLELYNWLKSVQGK